MKTCPRVLSFVPVLGAAAALSISVAAQAQPVEPVKVRAVAQFDFDRAALRSADAPSLLAEVGKLKDVTWQTVTAVGHTDDLGPDGYNRQLSLKRAQAVKAWLVAQGLDSRMIKVAGEGEAAPAVPNDGDAARAKNRRTEVTFEGVRASAK